MGLIPDPSLAGWALLSVLLAQAFTIGIMFAIMVTRAIKVYRDARR